MAINSSLAIQPVSKLSTNLPLSPMIPATSGPAAQPGVVQISLGAYTGQVVTGGEFGLATTMGNGNHDYKPYGDPTFQAVANQYPTDLLRHNWELNTLMDIMFPTRGSASTPNYSSIDNYLHQQGNFNNQTATQIVTLGFPSWLNIADPANQALYASMVKGIAQHFSAKGEPINNYELVNEPDGHYSVTDMANTSNVVAQALKSVDPSYKLGGQQTFFKIAAPNIGFVSWHQYVTNGADGKHALMCCAAFTDLQHLRLAGQNRTGPGNNAPPRSGTATIAEPARRAPRHHGQAVRPTRPARPVSLLQAPVPIIS